MATRGGQDMARERERRMSPERSKTLLVTSHFAVAGVIAAVWGGAQFGVGREADGQRSTVADHVTVVGMPVGASTAEVISVRVRLSAALQTTVREQNLSVTLRGMRAWARC